MLKIVHLIDDQNPGGVTRYLDFIASHPGMAAIARHEILPVPRTRAARSGIKADVIVSHLTLSWRGLPGLFGLRALYPGTPLIHVEHSYCEGFAAINVTRRRRFRAMLRTGYALFDKVVAVSAPQAAWMTRSNLVPADRLTVIPPCVALAPLAELVAPGAQVRRIGAIGRLDTQKGFDLLIQAFRALPFRDVTLEIFGDGPERAALQALAGSDRRIRFHGHTPPETALACSDAVVMPSRWEPFGLVATEALAGGRPLLVSGADGLAGHEADGARRVPEFTEPRWTRALSNLVTRPPQAPRLDRETAETRTIGGWRQLLDGLAPAA
ncbi:glycosyltransferase family 4 protein [Marinibacterium sp. SX1]|uniref:glycosyltransferase family 4 protein n=1 Tax=Marinibacterium sp. SX1 TaxID=3388424 RepID=UPI003D16697B